MFKINNEGIRTTSVTLNRKLHLSCVTNVTAESYLEQCQMSKMEPFAIIVQGFSAALF